MKISRATYTAAAQTASIYALNICAGLVSSIIGATLLELQTQVGVTIDWAAMLVAWLYLGRLPGTAAASLVFDRVAAEPALVTSSVVAAILVSVVPWCVSYVTMSVVIGLAGACTGFIGVGVNRFCFRLWPEPIVRQIVQSMNFFYSVGAALSPIIANHYLISSSSSIPSVSCITHVSKINTTVDHGFNESVPAVDDYPHHIDLIELFSGCSTNTSREANDTSAFQTEYHLYKPFVVVSGLQLISCVILLTVYIPVRCSRDVKSRSRDRQLAADQLVDHHHPIASLDVKPEVTSAATSVRSPGGRAVLSMLFGAFLLMHANVEVTYGSLLMPFCVRHLELTETTGNRVAFAYWLSSALGRLLGVVVSRAVVPDRLLAGSVGLEVATLAVLTGFAGADGQPSTSAVVAIWPCSVALGLAASTVFASTVSLAARYVGISSPLVALLLASFSAGSVVGPAAAGALFRYRGPAWFVRYVLGAALVAGGLFVVVRVVHERTRTRDWTGRTLSTESESMAGDDDRMLQLQSVVVGAREDARCRRS